MQHKRSILETEGSCSPNRVVSSNRYYLRFHIVRHEEGEYGLRIGSEIKTDGLECGFATKSDADSAIMMHADKLIQNASRSLELTELHIREYKGCIEIEYIDAYDGAAAIAQVAQVLAEACIQARVPAEAYHVSLPRGYVINTNSRKFLPHSISKMWWDIEHGWLDDVQKWLNHVQSFIITPNRLVRVRNLRKARKAATQANLGIFKLMHAAV